MPIEVWNSGELVQIDASQVLIPVGVEKLEIDRIFEHFGMRWSVPLPANVLILLPPGLYLVRKGGKVVCLSREGVARVEVGT